MKPGIPSPADRLREFCINCDSETVERVREDGRTLFYCRACGSRAERRIVLDPAMIWRVDENGRIWHESVGVFVRNRHGEFLFFKRTIFPVAALTVPSGHVDTGETPEQAAIRELCEEAGLEASRLVHIASHHIPGDSCRRGSDHHFWHAYLLVLDSPVEVTLGDGEGQDLEWLTLEKAKTRNLTYPVRYIIDRHATDLEG
jgi:8-oxo-dGTP pyrophosphatase MutT (NUDIX family)